MPRTKISIKILERWYAFLDNMRDICCPKPNQPLPSVIDSTAITVTIWAYYYLSNRVKKLRIRRQVNKLADSSSRIFPFLPRLLIEWCFVIDSTWVGRAKYSTAEGSTAGSLSWVVRGPWATIKRKSNSFWTSPSLFNLPKGIQNPYPLKPSMICTKPAPPPVPLYSAPPERQLFDGIRNLL